jgi:DNA-3-methyladenine glycosylase I
VQEVVEQEGSLGAFFWRYERGDRAAGEQASKELAKELKKRGWRFVGPTTVYAFMQSVGLVNDHNPDCETYEQVKSARAKFKAPPRQR